MKRSLLFVTLAGLVLGGCSTTPRHGEVEGVVFPAEEAGSAAGLAGRDVREYWTPSDSDIAEAMPVIQCFLEKNAPSIAKRLGQYRCQYFGFVVEGNKLIYCNFFHRDGGLKDWKTKPVFVEGGGDWYFQLEYDVESKSCLNFHVNGGA